MCPINQSILLVILLILAAGCQHPELSDIVVGHSYKPANSFKLAGGSPSQVRRVAVLPLDTPQTSGTAASAADALQPTLQTELLRTGRYEFVWVSKQYLWQTTGRRTWAGDEKLPAGFLDKLAEDFGCQAVLFGRVTQYRPYPPLAIGWRLQLIGVVEPFPIWAAEEMFDLTQTKVANGARRFEQKRQYAAQVPIDSKTIFYSAETFGQYTAQQILRTFPQK
jgi:hypothetical protein